MIIKESQLVEIITEAVLKELCAKIVRPNDSLYATAEVWTRGTSGGGEGDRNDTRGHFHYFSATDEKNHYKVKKPFSVEVALDNLCHLEVVRTIMIDGHPINQNGGDWGRLSKAKRLLKKWLNEKNSKTGVYNWVEILDNWNNENPNAHVKVEYANGQFFDLDAALSDAQTKGIEYNQINFPQIMFC